MKKSYFDATYKLDEFHDSARSVMSLLLLTNSQNFEKRRKEIIFNALGLSHPNSRSVCIKKYFELLSSRSGEKDGLFLRRLGIKRLDIPVYLCNQFSKKEITPYEAVGKLKDHNKWLSARAMTHIWATLSVIDGVDFLGDRALGDNNSVSGVSGVSGVINNWEKKIEQESKIPKLKALAESLDTAPKKGGFIENYPHLKKSVGAQTNWSEVVSSFSPQVGGLIKGLLDSSSQNIGKPRLIDNYLWPERGEKELENRRLNSFLESLGSRPSGRRRRYEKMLLNLEPEISVSQLPEVEQTPPSPSERRKIDKVIEKMSELTGGNSKVFRDGTIHHYKPDLGRLKKTNLKEARELWQICEPLLGEAHSLTFITSKLPRFYSLNQEHVIQRIKQEVEDLLSSGSSATIENRDKFKIWAETISQSEILVSELLSFIEDKEDFLENHVRGTLLEGFPVVEQWSRKILIDIPSCSVSSGVSAAVTTGKGLGDIKGLTGTRASEMLMALRENKEYDFTKPVHPDGLTPLHISALVGSVEELGAICEYFESKGSPINVKTKDGKSPLDMSNADTTEALLKYFSTSELVGLSNAAGLHNLHSGARSIINHTLECRQKIKKLRQGVLEENVEI